MADADVPIPAASGDRRIEATPVNLSCFADLTGNIGSHGNPVPVSCLPTTHKESIRKHWPTYQHECYEEDWLISG
jgi:hypothetical protein